MGKYIIYRGGYEYIENGIVIVYIGIGTVQKHHKGIVTGIVEVNEGEG